MKATYDIFVPLEGEPYPVEAKVPAVNLSMSDTQFNQPGDPKCKFSEKPQKKLAKVHTSDDKEIPNSVWSKLLQFDDAS